MQVIYQKVSTTGRSMQVHSIEEAAPHPKSYAAAVLLKDQLRGLDGTLHWHERVGLSRRIIRLSRADLCCAYCGGRLYPRGTHGRKRPEWATIDHKQPVSRGGHPADPKNIVICCDPCNHEKGSMTAEEYMAHRRRAGKALGRRLAHRAECFLVSGDRNAWVQTHDGLARAYVRRSVRMFDRDMEECFDIANIEVRAKMRGRGAFSEFVRSMMRVLPPDSPVLLESVLEPQLAEWANRSGWTPHGESVFGSPESYYTRVNRG